MKTYSVSVKGNVLVYAESVAEAIEIAEAEILRDPSDLLDNLEYEAEDSLLMY